MLAARRKARSSVWRYLTPHGVRPLTPARYTLDNLNKEYNALNKAVAKLKIVRPRVLRRPAVHTS